MISETERLESLAELSMAIDMNDGANGDGAARVSRASLVNTTKALGIDLPKLSDAQRNVLLAIDYGDTAARYYIPSTLVSLCCLGLTSLSDNGFMRLSLKGHLVVRALKEAAAIADEDRG